MKSVTSSKLQNNLDQLLDEILNTDDLVQISWEQETNLDLP